MVRRLCVVVTAIAVLSPVGLAGAAPRPCPPGKATVTIAGATSCRPATGYLLPGPTGATSAATSLAEAALASETGDLLWRLTPLTHDFRVPSARLAAVRKAVPMLHRLAKRAGTLPAARVLAAGWVGGPLRDERTTTTVSRRATAKLRQAGLQGTLAITGAVPVAAGGEVQTQDGTLGVALSARAPGFGVTLDVQDEVGFEEACPTAEGFVDASEAVTARLIRQEPVAGRSYREVVTLRSAGRWRGLVDPYAELTAVDFTASVEVGVARSGPALRGIPHGASRFTFTILAEGHVDLKLGQTTYTRLEISGAGVGTGATRRQVAAALREDGATYGSRMLVADVVQAGVRRLRAAEPVWQREDRCATAVLSPGASDIVPSGLDARVTGAVVARHGGASEGRWAPPVMERGYVTGGLPAESAPGVDVAFTVRGGEADGARQTVVLSGLVTSRAGVARARWVGRTPAGFRVTLQGSAEAGTGTPLPQGPLVRSTFSATIDAVPDPAAGAGVLTGTAPLAYSGTTVVPGSCDYVLGGVSGNATASVSILPTGQVLVYVTIADSVTGTFSGDPPGCLGGDRQSPLASGVGYTSGPRTVAVPVSGGDGTLSWAAPGSATFDAQGTVTLHVAPL